MPYRTLILFLGATLYAQTAPPVASPQAADQSQETPRHQWQFRLSPPPQSVSPIFGQRKWFSPGVTPAPATTPWHLLPDWTAKSQPGVNRPASLDTAILAKPCAIPLTNVLRPNGPVPQMRKVLIPEGHFPIVEAVAPAPACKDW
jgi:hypothetical protein